MPSLKLSTKSTSASEESQHKSVGLAQSALMCIDVLAKFLAKKPDWVKDLERTLTEVMTLISSLAALTDPQTSNKSSSKLSTESIAEYLKLQGSAFLCCGTLCGQLGPKSLSQLSVSNLNHF